MKNYIAKRFQNISGGLSLDTEALSRYSDVIDMSIGDTDFITDSRIIDAAFSDAWLGYTKYGDPKGDPELIDAVIKAYKEDFSIDISRENLFVTASSCMGMGLTMMALLDPGDEVIVFSPYFTMYRSQIELSGGVCVEVPTYGSEGYAINGDRLRAAITPKTKAIIFNNPCNPTGAAYGIDTLKLLYSIAEERDLLIVADEIYTRYMFNGPFVPVCSFPGAMKRTVTLNSFSKNFMMTGWRIGYIIASPHIVNTVMHVNN
ncbi:MAG: aminotransferase class I/II-fold pyridoxal phosphate-dependent enzyme, partial [Clostridiales bacterium]|nr:aminotransferase class I/II-fold pyridoxal phosphate-dependent enzyme [Clostridiales bacterium]